MRSKTLSLAAFLAMGLPLALLLWLVFPAGADDRPPRATPEEEAGYAEGTFLIGELNGFTFNFVEFGPAALSPSCVGVEADDATPEEIDKSHLAFEPAYVPFGLTVHKTQGVKCQGRVIAVSVFFRASAGQRAISIHHYEAPPRVATQPGRERFHASSVAGRRAVTIEASDEVPVSFLYVLDGETYWALSGPGDILDELIKVAESLF
jgi:hypothetical protein